MESAVTLVAEWFSHVDMIKLQGVSVLKSVNSREWQYKDTVDEIGDQVWEEWALHMYEAGDSPAFFSVRRTWTCAARQVKAASRMPARSDRPLT